MSNKCLLVNWGKRIESVQGGERNIICVQDEFGFDCRDKFNY